MQIRRGWAAQWTGAYADETVTAGPAGGRASCWGGEVGPGEGWPRGPAGLGRGAAAMIRAFSFPVSPERGRLRGWLEGSLAGLCELHWLRERQEYRVQQALRLAQPGMGGAEAEDEEDADEDEDAAAARRAAAALEEQLVRGRLSVCPSALVCVCLSVSVGCSDTRPGGGGKRGKREGGWGWRVWAAGGIRPPCPQTGEGDCIASAGPSCDAKAHSLHPFPKANPSGRQVCVKPGLSVRQALSSCCLEDRG